MISRIERETTSRERSTKPFADAWSLTEIVQHLGLVALGLLRASRDTGAPPVSGDALAKLRDWLKPGVRIKAPVEQIVPRPGVTWDNAVETVRSGVASWSEFIGTDAFIRNTFRHPFAGTLTGHEALQFMLLHLEHHVPQIERTLAETKRKQ